MPKFIKLALEMFLHPEKHRVKDGQVMLRFHRRDWWAWLWLRIKQKFGEAK